ncbi:MAG: AraC family transcriptional regulator [Filimonas sp.]|nr:AraC family transcriptional regulator [Filimonas sp.]
MKQLALGILAYAAQRDVDTNQLCKLAGIKIAELKKEDHATLTGQQVHDLWLNASRLTGDALFGLHMGESMRPAALGIIGNIIQSSATVGEALTHAASLTHLVTTDCRMEITRDKSSFSVSLLPIVDPQKADAFSLRHLIEMLMVMVVHELDGLLLDKIIPQSIYLPYMPEDIDEYTRVLRCTPVKRANKYELKFPNRYWDISILTANYELQGLLLQKISKLPQPKSGTQTLRTRIYNYLLANSYLGVVSLNDISANFNMSSRSLQRKLKEEATSFQDIADEVRHALAEYYISSGNYALKDISWMLGYNELSAFTRAFKRWTGQSPLSYSAS